MTVVLSSACVTNNHEYVGVEVDGRWLGRAEQGQHQQVRRGLRRRQERPEVHHVRLGPRVGNVLLGLHQGATGIIALQNCLDLYRLLFTSTILQGCCSG